VPIAESLVEGAIGNQQSLLVSNLVPPGGGQFWMPLSPIPAVARSSLALDSTSSSFGSVHLAWHTRPYMNPHAKESIPEYALRRCTEDLDQARHERRFVQSIYAEAMSTHAEESIATIQAWLPRSRKRINRLSAQKTRLRRALEIRKEMEGTFQSTRTLTSVCRDHS
jgi:hypothetical protein